jgi:hypothetical protein
MLFDDADPEILISRLSGPLAPPDRVAFRRAAESALEQIPCAGEGIVYRVLREVWRNYFVPLDPNRTCWDIAGELPGMQRSRLVNQPPIEYGGDLRHVRYRKPRLVS